LLKLNFLKNLKETHKIHLHCFTGGWKLGKMFLDKFPNLCIGVTSLITFRTANSAHELVKNIPIERLLFETDSPYFLPQIEKVSVFLAFNFQTIFILYF
jgi:TatD DNase family protein